MRQQGLSEFFSNSGLSFLELDVQKEDLEEGIHKQKTMTLVRTLPRDLKWRNPVHHSEQAQYHTQQVIQHLDVDDFFNFSVQPPK